MRQPKGYSTMRSIRAVLTFPWSRLDQEAYWEARSDGGNKEKKVPMYGQTDREPKVHMYGQMDRKPHCEILKGEGRRV